MSRLFGTALDKVSCGSAAVVDDLIATQHTLVLSEVRRNTSGVVLPVAGKGGANQGWVFYINDLVGVPGFLYFLAERATTDTVLVSNLPLSINAHGIVGFSFDASQATGTNGVTFYGNSLELPAINLGATAAAAGSGAYLSDAAANLIVGNYGVADTPFKGDLGWTVIVKKATAWTLAQVLVVQQGMLALKAAREAGGALTRGLAMINSFGNAALILEVKSDGTVTDQSVNAATCTLTGTTAGTDQTGHFAPTSFEDDLEPSHASDLREQTTYRYTSAFARKSFVTTADGFTIWGYSTLATLGGADVRTDTISYLVDGVYQGEITTAGVAAIFSGTVSGLGSASKTITLINGPRLRIAATAARPWYGTFLTHVRFTAAATEQTPATRARPLVVLGDSHMEGWYASPIAQLGVSQKLRLNPPAGYDGVIMHSAGGLALNDVGVDAAARTALATLLTTPTPRAVLVELCFNDHYLNLWTAANYQTALSDLITKLLAAFSGRVYVTVPIIVPATGNPGEGANGNGETMTTFRTAVRNAATGLGRVTLIDLSNVVSLGNFDTDQIHPNNTGHGELYTYLRRCLVQGSGSLLHWRPRLGKKLR